MPRLLAVIALLAACSQNPGTTTIAITYDPCDPLVVVPAASTTADELHSISEALDMWNRLAGTRLTLDDTSANAAAPHVPLTFQAAPGAFYGLYEDKVGDVLINANLVDDHQRAVCIAHELGHVMGLVHVYDRDSVMNSPNLTIEPNTADVADVAKLWGACAPAGP